jgi:ArsR family transcriptional regulator
MNATQANAVDRMFRALSDPTRLRILNLLLRGELCVCDIVNTLRMPQPAISRHLAYLKESGLVEARRDGLWMYYRLTPSNTAFHEKLIQCVGCCVEEVPQLAKDSKALARNRCC